MIDLAFDGPEEMGREIAGAPEVADRSLAEVFRLRPALDNLLAGSSATVLLGTGMSLAAAAAAAPAWRRARRLAGQERPLVVRESTAAALGSDDGRIWQPGELVVAISKSGTSPETLVAARRAVDGGAVVLAVTAEAGSPLAGVASLVLPTPIGEEKGAGTRSATAALAALLAICGALDAGPAARAGVSANLRRVVESWPAMAVLGSPLAAAGRTWVVGLGSGVGLADAAAITWHEKVRRPAVGLSASEFRHGPIEAARAGDAVIVVDPDEPVPARTTYMDRLRGELTNLGVTVVWLGPASPGRSDPAGVDSAGVTDVSLAARPGPAAALEALVRLQQLARATAHAAGTYRDGFAVLHSIVTAATDI